MLNFGRFTVIMTWVISVFVLIALAAWLINMPSTLTVIIGGLLLTFGGYGLVMWAVSIIKSFI